MTSPYAPDPSTWRGNRYSRIGARQFADIAARTVAKLEKELGVRVPDQSRLRLAAARVAELATPEQQTLGPLEREALRTIWDFAVIANAAPKDHPRVQQDLGIALKGPLLQGEQPNDTPRDLQFQLYVGAVFAMANVPIIYEEPDFRFLLNGVERGMAVKRIRSTEKVEARLTDGAKQLATAGVRGLVVANIDAFLKGRTFAGIADPKEAGRQFNLAVEPLHRRLPKLLGRPAALGVLGMGTAFEWVTEEGKTRLDQRWFYQFRWFTDDPLEAKVYEDFVHAFMAKIDERMIGIFEVAN